MLEARKIIGIVAGARKQAAIKSRLDRRVRCYCSRRGRCRRGSCIGLTVQHRGDRQTAGSPTARHKGMRPDELRHGALKGHGAITPL